MNKKFIAALLAVSATTASFGTAALADDEIKVLVNGSAIEFDTEPFIENDRTLVPMRAIFEALGAYVDWDGETRTIVSYDPVSDVSITMQIDSNKMFVGETAIELDVPAKIVNDRTVVPLRAISEGMNSKVGWDGETRTVTVEKEIKKPGENVNPENTQIANPWVEYKSLDELNEAIGDYKFSPIKNAAAEPVTFKYNAEAQLSEVVYSYSRPNDKTPTDITVRKQPGDTDISGIYGGEKLTEYKVEGVTLAEIYVYEETMYAVFSVEDRTIYSHSITISSGELSSSDALVLIKSLVDEVVDSYPKG